MLHRDIHRTKAGTHFYKSICLKSKAKKDFEGITDRLNDINSMEYHDRIEEARKLLSKCEGKIAAMIEAINEEQ